MNTMIKEHERIDDLHRNGLKIIQDPKNFCFGVDAVLLAHFAKVRKEELVLDLGTGTGIIPILLYALTKGKKFIGLEIQKDSVDIARRSLELNNITDAIEIHEGDIKELATLYKPSSFDVITTNPPYMNAGGGIINDYSPKAIARHEILCSLEDIVAGASKLLKTSGRFYMINRPNRLIDIICTMRNYKLEPKVIRFIHSYVDKEPTMVLVEAVRSGKPFLTVMPPIIIYDAEGKYTSEVMDIYYG